MQTLTVENSVKHGLFRQVITPDERRNSIPIPKEWYGMEVEVILFPVPAKTPPAAKPFFVPRRRVGSARASSNPAMLSENLIRADRDAR